MEGQREHIAPCPRCLILRGEVVRSFCRFVRLLVSNICSPGLEVVQSEVGGSRKQGDPAVTPTDSCKLLRSTVPSYKLFTLVACPNPYNGLRFIIAMSTALQEIQGMDYDPQEHLVGFAIRLLECWLT